MRKLTTYDDGGCDLIIEEGGKRYSIMALVQGDLVLMQIDETGSERRGFKSPTDGSIWSTLEAVGIAFREDAPPTIISAEEREELSGAIALRQRELA